MNNGLATDQQIIDRVRRAQRYRRPIGAVAFALGLVGAAIICYWVHDLHSRSLEVLNQIADAPRPTTQQLHHQLDEINSSWQFSLGFALAAGLSGACSITVHGLTWLLFKNRKDCLLLKCWDGRKAAFDDCASNA